MEIKCLGPKGHDHTATFGSCQKCNERIAFTGGISYDAKQHEGKWVFMCWKPHRHPFR